VVILRRRYRCGVGVGKEEKSGRCEKEGDI